jgi:hypothetical protein
MLSAGWVIAALLFTILLTSWITLTLTRLDRLHARVDAAQAALDAQLVRRAAALLYLVEKTDSPIPASAATELARAAQQALSVTDPERQAVENRVGKALSELNQWRSELPVESVDELSEASSRVVIARRFYNDAVRDTRTLRARRMPRALHLAGHRELPSYFDIDDTALLDDWAPASEIETPQPPIG